MDLKLVNAIMVSILVILVLKLLNWAWIRPKKLEKLLRMQGIQGNSYKVLVGDMRDFITSMKTEQPKIVQLSYDPRSHILPYYHYIIHKYGKQSLIWFGPTPRLNITDPELLKEILNNPSVFQKPVPDPIGKPIAGGLLSLEDDKWDTHRRIVNPAFHLQKLKINGGALFSSNERKVEVDVWPYLVELPRDVISRTAFGSSHEQGRRIFELQREQVRLVLQLLNVLFIPGLRYFPSRANRRMKAISGEIKSLLRGIINQRIMERGELMSDDLLGTLMESNAKEIKESGNKNMGLSIDEVIEECKLFYFAGSETSSDLLVWTMVMLAKHHDWQHRARQELLQVFGNEKPTYDGINQLKTVTMILYEVLRMYPPAPLIIRAPTKTVKLGNLMLPKGAQLSLLIGLVHYDPNIWGDDVNEFKPDRFSQRISSAAKSQFSFLPFSSGPRVCIGQNFVMVEAKLALAVMLQRFSFELSPSYRHAPFSIMTLQPQYGAPIILHKL